MTELKKIANASLWIIALLVMVASSGCEKQFLGQEPQADPENTLIALRDQFKAHYGLFKVKNIDWELLYQSAKTDLGENASPRQLYNAMISMLFPLNDAHVTLYPNVESGLPTWSSDLDANGRYVIDFFDLGVVRNRYCPQMQSKGVYDYGMIGKVGYLHIREFPNTGLNEQGKVLDQILSELQGALGIVIDVRDNSGGADPIAQYVAGKFAKVSSAYMKSRKKTGPAESDFSDWTTWTVSPKQASFTKPVALLTEKGTQSAAESFTLALTTQAHVRSFGGKTAGAFSDNILKELPNGWLVSLSVGDYRDQNGVSYEGTGLVPNVPLAANKAELIAGKDRVLEKAIEHLNTP